MRANIEEKSARPVSPQMFAQYFKLKEELQRLSDQEGKMSPDRIVVQQTRLDTELQELNKNIISGLGTTIPSSISQEMLIKWCKYNFHDFDNLTTEEQKKSAFIPLFSRKYFLDRLLLGKGGKDYEKKAVQYAQAGEGFVKNMFMSGPSETASEEKKDEDPAKQPFPTLNHSLPIPRKNISNYLSRESNLDESELAHIKSMQVIATEESKIKWEALQKYLRSQTRVVEENKDVQSNVKELIYVDLISKAIMARTNPAAEDKDMLDYLYGIVDQHPEDTYADLLDRQEEKENPNFIKLSKHIDEMAGNYFLTGNASDSYLRSNYSVNLKGPVSLLIKNQSTDVKSQYTPLFNTIGWMLLKGEKLPDFVTREDLLNLFIYDPNRILTLNCLDNPSFIERIGDFTTFKDALTNKAKRFRKIGVYVDDNLEKAMARLDADKIKQAQDDKINQYQKTLDAITPVMNKMNEFVQIWEVKNAYQAHADDFNQMWKNMGELWINEGPYNELKAYLEAINNHKNISITSISETLYDQLEKHLAELTTLENLIEEKTRLEPSENKFDKPLEEIREKKAVLVAMRNKIKSLEDYSSRNAEPNMPEIKGENELKGTIPPYNINRTKPKRADQQRILYLIIMTGKSISEGKPDRKYLKELYDDRDLYLLLNRGLHPGLKQRLERIENELIVETARNFSAHQTMDMIKTEIEAETTPKSRQRINHFWIQVMQQAYDRHDMQTVKMIDDALAAQDRSQLLGAEVFSKQSKQQLEQLRGLSKTALTPPSIGSTPAPVNPAEVKSSVPSVTEQKLAEIKLWLDNKHPDPKKIITENDLGNYLAYQILPLVKDELIKSKDFWNNTQRFEKAVSITRKLARCNTLSALRECLSMLKKDLHLEHSDVWVNCLAQYVNIMKGKALLKLIGAFEELKLNMDKDKQMAIPTAMIAKNMIEYLRLVRAGWEIQQLKDKIPNKQKSLIDERINLIDEYIKKLETSPGLTLNDFNELQTLSHSLEHSLKPPLSHNSLFVSGTRESKAEYEILSQTKEDIDSIKLNIIPCIDVLMEKPLQQSSPLTKPNVEPLPLSPKEWMRTAISPQNSVSTPVHASTPPSDHKLPILKDAEYEHIKSKTHIRESMQDIHTVHIGVTQEPANYSTLKESEKAKIDLLIAESMVRLLVSRCGNSKEVPVFIYDSDNQNRMRAFILVCRAHELEYKAPQPSDDSYEFLKHPEMLDKEVAKVKKSITPQSRIMGKTVSHAAVVVKAAESSESKESEDISHKPGS